MWKGNMYLKRKRFIFLPLRGHWLRYLNLRSVHLQLSNSCSMHLLCVSCILEIMSVTKHSTCKRWSLLFCLLMCMFNLCIPLKLQQQQHHHHLQYQYHYHHHHHCPTITSTTTIPTTSTSPSTTTGHEYYFERQSKNGNQSISSFTQIFTIADDLDFHRIPFWLNESSSC